MLSAFDEVMKLAERYDANVRFSRKRNGRCRLEFVPNLQNPDARKEWLSDLPCFDIQYDYPRGAFRVLLKQIAPDRFERSERAVNEAEAWHDVITYATPRQQAKVAVLLAHLKALKEEILSPTPIEEIEPYLASPRSSLNPEHLNGEKAGEDGFSAVGYLK